MSGFNDIVLNQNIVMSIFNDIKDKVLICCDTMKNDLINKSQTILNNEPIIRDYLLENYLQNNYIRKKFNITEFTFEPEVREKNGSVSIDKYGNVDIKIIIKRLTFDDTNAYFIIECKRIDGSQTLNDAYVKNGVCRFVSQDSYYTTYQNKNIMLGFVVNNIDINNNAKKINVLQNTSPSLSIVQELLSISAENFIYNSKYNHSSTIIELHHIFYDFASIII